jgi:hypothetical protein
LCCATLLVGCTDAAEPSAVRIRQDVWQESAILSAEQKRLLVDLQRSSAGAFAVQEWSAGASVLDLHLGVAIDPGVNGEGLNQFLEKYGEIWHINSGSIGKLAVVRDVKVAKTGCRLLDVQLHRDGKPVFNATLRFSVSNEGTLVRVVGLMDGRRLAVERVGRVVVRSGPEARAIALKRLGLNPDEAVSFEAGIATKPAWFDSYFTIGESLHDRTGSEVVNPAWFVRSEGGPTNGVFPVDAATGEVGIDGPSFSDESVLDTPTDACSPGLDPNESGTAWLARVIVDPMTGSPSSMSVAHFGGLKLAGTSSAERALNLFRVPQVQRMYGDAAPWDHLVVRWTENRGARSFVRLDQFIAQRRVEGAYLRLEFDGSRVQQAVSHLAYLPRFSTSGLATRIEAQAGIINWLRANLCAAGSCGHIDSQIPQLKFEEEVVWTSTIQDQLDQAARPASEIAARFRMNQTEIWYGLSSRAILSFRSPSQRLMADLPNQVWSLGAPRIQSCSNVGGPVFREKCERLVSVSLLTPPEFRLEVDVVGTSFPPLDSRSLPSFLSTDGIADTLLSSYGFRNVLGDGGVSQFNPQSRIELVLASFNGESANANAVVLQDRNLPETENLGVFIGPDVWSADVIAHEYAHHITRTAYQPMQMLEQGAVSEALSDFVGAVVFPAADGSWRIALSSPKGAVRNMKEPRDPTVADGAFAVDRYQDKGRCDPRFALSGCQYQWMGIPSRALSLIADGPPNTTTAAFGRVATLGLVLEVLRAHGTVWKLDSSDRILNLRLKLEAACRNSVTDQLARAQWAGTRTITSQDCLSIGRAFDEVGVPVTIRSGFDRYGATRSGSSVTKTLQGARLFNGCRITGHTLHAELRDPENVLFDHRSRSSTDSPPLFIDISGGEVVAQVTERCGSTAVATCPDPLARQISYTIDSKWLADLKVWTDETIDTGGLSIENCLRAQPTSNSRARRLHSSPIFALVSFGPFGSRSDRRMAPNLDAAGTFTPAPCLLLEVGGIDGHRGPIDFPASYQNVGAPLSSTFHHGSHGFTATWVGASSDDFTVDHHAWVNGFSGIYSRVVYEAEGPTTSNCEFGGPTQFVVAP